MIPNFKNFPEESEARRLSRDGKSEHDRLVDILDELSLFRDPLGQIWVRLPDDEIKIVCPLHSPQLRDWLEVEYGRRYRYLRRPRPANLRTALHSTRARAAATGCREYPVFHRFHSWGLRAGPAVAEPTRITLDLADPHGNVLEITPGGHEILPGEHCHFSRTGPMQEILPPRRPQSRHHRQALLGRLRRLFRPASNRDFHRILAWLHSALHPSGPYPVLVLHGDFHQATTVAHLLRSTIDPTARHDNRFPSSDSQLDRQTRDNWILYFDGLNRITPRRAAALCSLAATIRRPVIVTLARKNANTPPLDHESLEPLCLTVELTPVPTDLTDWPTLEELTPDILGLLVDSVSAALTNIEKVAEAPHDLPPRLRDAYLWTVSAADALTLTPEEIRTAFAPDEPPDKDPDKNPSPQPKEKEPTYHSSEIKSPSPSAVGQAFPPASKSPPAPSVPPVEQAARLATLAEDDPHSNRHSSGRPMEIPAPSPLKVTPFRHDLSSSRSVPVAAQFRQHADSEP